MPLPPPPYYHGKEGKVFVAGDGTTYAELDATEWSGNPFAVDEHVFGTFRSNGAKRAVGGLSGGSFTVTVKARTDEDIRSATFSLVEGNYVPMELREPGMTQGHRGRALIRSVAPRVAANAEMEYVVECTSDDAWERGTREPLTP